MKLHPIKARNLRLAEVGQFIVRYFTDIDSLGLDLKKDIDFYTVHIELKMRSNAYHDAMKQIKAMAETKELEMLDMQRDHMITTLRRAVSVFEYSNNKDEKNAYQIAMIIMRSYTDLESENYEAETFDIQKLLKEWSKPENEEIIEKLELLKHIGNLKNSAEAFDNLFNNRSTTTVRKVSYNTLALKKQMMDSYGKLVHYVTGMISVKSTDKDFYIQILDAINNGRKYFADILARRKGIARKDTADTTRKE
ncbi:hypothetical protein F0919_04575 [Taibaiella lutea]|uniref:Uncharacterized protein n=1 Tax=Taibaiella lutea TaxID=2608001 RepID=A0A5M6CPS5_9BACT|nr:DUF6261 family protein [Taibaiella lutea]KAA5536953.1 hypothetical protein F0919_04575 [Taibaiella lutea]